jgi:hypothetical protein
MGLELFYGAYVDLDGDRPAGWSTRPIPWGVIRDYGSAYGITGDQLDDLFYFIRAMDKAYIEHLNKKAKQKKKGQQ